jgi:hypothetical protein
MITKAISTNQKNIGSWKKRNLWQVSASLIALATGLYGEAAFGGTNVGLVNGNFTTPSTLTAGDFFEIQGGGSISTTGGTSSVVVTEAANYLIIDGGANIRMTGAAGGGINNGAIMVNNGASLLNGLQINGTVTADGSSSGSYNYGINVNGNIQQGISINGTLSVATIAGSAGIEVGSGGVVDTLNITNNFGTTGSIIMTQSSPAILLQFGGTVINGLNIRVNPGTAAIQTNNGGAAYYVSGAGQGGSVSVQSGDIAMNGSGTMFLIEGAAEDGRSYSFAADTNYALGAGSTFLQLGSSNAHTNTTINHAGNLNSARNSITGYKIGHDSTDVTINISGTLDTGSSSNSAVTNITGAPQIDVNLTGSGSVVGAISLGADPDSSITHSSSGAIDGAISMGHANQKLILTGDDNGGITGTINGGQVLVTQMTTPFILANTMGGSSALEGLSFDTVSGATLTGPITTSGTGANAAGISLSKANVINSNTITTAGTNTIGLDITNESGLTNLGNMTTSGSTYGVHLDNASLNNAGKLTITNGGFYADATNGTPDYTAIITASGGSTASAANVGQIIYNPTSSSADNTGIDFSEGFFDIETMYKDSSGTVQHTMVSEGDTYTLATTTSQAGIKLPDALKQADGTYAYNNGFMAFNLATTTTNGTTVLSAELAPAPAMSDAMAIIHDFMTNPDMISEIATSSGMTENDVMSHMMEMQTTIIAQGPEKFEATITAATTPANATAGPSGSVAAGVGAPSGSSITDIAFLNFGNTLADTKSGTATSAGSEPFAEHGLKFWGKGLASRDEQEKISGYSGYVSRTYGGSAGVTSTLQEGLKLGVSLNLLNSKINEKADEVSNTKSKSTILALYGFYSPSHTWYTEGTLSGGTTSYQSARLAATNDTYLSKFNGFTGSMNAKLGRYIQLQGDMELKTYIAAQPSLTRIQSHKEEGPQPIGFDMGADTIKSLQTGGGIALTTHKQINEDWRAIPQLSATYMHEFFGKSRNVNATWIGQPIAIATPEFGTESVTLGGGLEVRSRGGVSVGIDASATLKNKFTSYTGNLRVAYKFKAAETAGAAQASGSTMPVMNLMQKQ